MEINSLILRLLFSRCTLRNSEPSPGIHYSSAAQQADPGKKYRSITLLVSVLPRSPGMKREEGVIALRKRIDGRTVRKVRDYYEAEGAFHPTGD